VVAVTTESKLSAVVGDKTAKKLQKAFGYGTVGELLHHYPRSYITRGETSDIDSLRDGEYVTVIGRVEQSSQHPYRDRRTGRTAYRHEMTVAIEGGLLSLTFFDVRRSLGDWREKRHPVGSQGMFAGKAAWNRYKKRWELVHPDTDMAEERPRTTRPDPRVARDGARAPRELSELRPIYPATKQVSSWTLEGALRVVLDLVEEVPDPVPAEVRRSRGLVGADQALEWVHQPDTWAEKGTAERAIRFQEAFVAQTILAQRRRRTLDVPAVPRRGRGDGLLDRFDASLPFSLTSGQVDVCEQILDDLARDHPMHRLLQGEVGSGKTVVALRAMLRVVDSGGQAALLAPTEVLAQQHHRSITALLGELAHAGMLGGADDGTQVSLLTGSLGAAARRSALLDVASGVAGIVVGTHALLEERVQFADLGMVVVDEQHRFGVEQRAALGAKGDGARPHVLVMTATPIPRTVAMTVFGDLETSTLTELPAGRAPIQTNVVPLAEQPAWLDRVWGRVREEVEKGNRAYVVCPRIGGEQEEDSDLAAVEELAPALADDALKGLRVEALHGRMPADRKDLAMRQFAAGEVDVLVSTTVIEVGVDVPEATVMVILDADRFGVSQLHQMRGRVGRGGLPGLCLLVTRAEAGTPARERLDAVAGTVDGFELSRVDLAQRREGDVLGTSQSGRRSGLRKLSVLDHEEIIVDARHDATSVVEADPDLVGHPALTLAVRELVDSAQADYLEKA